MPHAPDGEVSPAATVAEAEHFSVVDDGRAWSLVLPSTGHGARRGLITLRIMPPAPCAGCGKAGPRCRWPVTAHAGKFMVSVPGPMQRAGKAITGLCPACAVEAASVVYAMRTRP